MNSPHGRRSPTYALVAACLATLMLVLDITVINTALSKIAHSLSTGLSGVQWIFDGYALPLAALVLTAGVLADRFGRRRLFITGLGLFTAASAACGLAGSIEFLDAARAVQGVGAAILFAVALALIAHATPQPAARTKAMAIYGGTIGFALAIGPLVGGALTQAVSWRAVFLVNVPVGALALWLTVTRIGESRDPRTRRIDWVGQVVLIVSLFALTLGLLQGNQKGWSSAIVLLSLIGGAVLLIAFGLIELRSTEPMLPLQLLRRRDFAGVQLSVFCISASVFAIYLYLSLYLEGPLGRSPLQTGFAYVPGSVLMFFASMATPRLVARVGGGRLATAAMALGTAGLLLLLLTRADSTWTITLPATIAIMVAAGLYNPAASMIAMSVLSEDQSGLASGAYDTFRQAGLAIGTAALGAFIPAGALTGGASRNYVGPLHHAVLAAAGVALVGTLVTGWALGRRESTVEDPTVGEPLATSALEPAAMHRVLAESEV